MANPLIQFRVNTKIKELIRKRAKTLGFVTEGDYLVQLARKEIAENGERGSLTIVAEKRPPYGDGSNKR